MVPNHAKIKGEVRFYLLLLTCLVYTLISISVTIVKSFEIINKMTSV